VAKCGQEHLFAFWEVLDSDQRHTLLGEMLLANCDRVGAIYKQADKNDDWSALAQRAEPPISIRLNAADGRFSDQQNREAGKPAEPR